MKLRPEQAEMLRDAEREYGERLNEILVSDEGTAIEKGTAAHALLEEMFRKYRPAEGTHEP